MKRSSWSDYQKEIADDKYYYAVSYTHLTLPTN